MNAQGSSLSSGRKRPHVLLVDDFPLELQSLASELRTRDYRLSIAFDGYQGYLHAKVLQPDLILLDVRMPRTDGFAACRLLKADATTRSIPVIFLSSAATTAERIEGLQAGAVDYLCKPFHTQEALLRIQIHLGHAWHSSFPTVDESPESGVNDAIVAAAVNFIVDNLGESITIESIAQRVGVHEKKLTRIFRERFSCTVSHYLREERLNKAKSLLQETELSVQDVAALVGFQNAANFSTAFRERFGATPLRWRQSVPVSPA